MSTLGRDRPLPLQLLGSMIPVVESTSHYWKPAACPSDCQVKQERKHSKQNLLFTFINLLCVVREELVLYFQTV